MKTGLGLVSVFVLLAGSSERAISWENTGSPNVLFVIVDDMTTTIAAQGHPAAVTPNLDALAKSGVRFDRAYCQFSVCNPARQSFLTGCYPQTTGVFDLSTSFRVALPDAVSLPQHFGANDYRTGLVGKIFHVPDPKTEVDKKVGSFLRSDQRILDEEKQNDPTDTARGEKHAYNRPYAASDRPDSEFTDHQIADGALEVIREFQGEPFFLAVGFIRPHTPYVAPQWAFDAIDRDKIVLPPYYRGEGEDTAVLPKAALRPNNNAFRYEPPTREQAIDATHAYLAAVHFVDHQLGRLVAELEKLGLKENTIIALTGDHGYHLGEHGLWAKQTLFEAGNHVPLIFAGPGIVPGVSKALVEQVDIFPTLSDLAGLPKLEQWEGVSLAPWIEDPKSKGRIAVFSSMRAPLGRGKLASGHSVRNARYRYIEWDGGKSGTLLYDLIKDPDEQVNLAGQAEHSRMERRLQKLLRDHLGRFAANGASAEETTF